MTSATALPAAASVSVVEVSPYPPPYVAPIGELPEPVDIPAAQLRVFERFYGLRSVRLAPGTTPADTLLAAAAGLRGLPGNAHRVRYVIAARTWPIGAPEEVCPVDEVRRRLRLTAASAFTVTQQGCASGLLAVELAGRLLVADGDPDALALVLTGERAFSPVMRFIPGTTVMGESTAAALIGVGGQRNRMLGYATLTDARFADDIAPSADYQHEYPRLLAEVLRAATHRAGLTLADVRLLLPHNVNRHSWLQLAHRLGFPAERIFLDNVPVTGHCFCADPFINLATAVRLGRLAPGDRYLMATAGMGAAFAAMLFEH